ncbi:MAG TPA: inositol monophosphatase family protein [Terriglobia bacterium]|nr:inositol monophosphatase family protein [Terriglobia bacterium]
MEYLQFAIEVAREAGGVLKHYMNREKHVELKGRANLVTIADKEAEDLIISRIRQRYPGHSILAEESGQVVGSACKWIIDPVDGTTNFAHQYPFFCVSIGFEQDGKLLCGAVYDPWRDEMFSGGRGLGSFVNGERMQVSDAGKLADALIMTGFPYGMRDKMDIIISQFRAFLFESQAVRRGGSAALDLCYNALGRVDGFWEMDLHPWDTAAAVVILEEAGGRVSDFSGGPFSIYGKQIVASNGRIHDEMHAVLRKLN